MSEHQFLSSPHFDGKALSSGFVKVFRGLFVLILLASLVGWATSPANAADFDPAVTCYKLTIDHTGMGSNPIATPTKSVDCNAGEYLEGATITLSGAISASGYKIGGWRGTINNASLANTNTVIMPASNVATSGVDYVLIVNFTFHADTYPILPDASAPGTLSPPGSSDFSSGETFMETATPNPGWTFVGWGGDVTGTANPVSITMSKEMLAQAYFIKTNSACHTLILNHSGKGTTPTTVAPVKSSACEFAHEYVTGETITISGTTPDSGYKITGWRGTNNNTSRSGTNTLTMPANHVFVFADYGLVTTAFFYMPMLQK